GLLGRDLDATAPLPADAPPMSYLLAAWASSFQSPAAAQARRLLGAQDFKHPRTVVFPSLAVFLFVSDLARGTTSAVVVNAPTRQQTAEMHLAAAHVPTGIVTA